MRHANRAVNVFGISTIVTIALSALAHDSHPQLSVQLFLVAALLVACVFLILVGAILHGCWIGVCDLLKYTRRRNEAELYIRDIVLQARESSPRCTALDTRKKVMQSFEEIGVDATIQLLPRQRNTMGQPAFGE